MGKIFCFVAGLITGCLLTFVLMGSLLMFRVHLERDRAEQAREEALMERERAEQAMQEAMRERDVAERQRTEAEAQRQRDKE
jgi:hypothetical protein